MSEKDLNCEIIKKALNNNNKNNEDIIFLWKEYIVEEYLKKNNLVNLTNLTKEVIKILLKKDYNLSQIYNIIGDCFYKIISDKNFKQNEIIETLFSIITCYEIRELDYDLIRIIKNNYNSDKSEFNSKVVLDFYLKASEKGSSSLELTIFELLQSLKNMNINISEAIIRQREEQIKIIHFIINDKKYKTFKKIDFQNWTKRDFPKLKFNKEYFNENTAKVLGMISLAIKQEKGFNLRNAQLIAILMLIGKDDKYGLIEEISTGEGKSIIIASLSIYFALQGKKVDIISSSYILARRDSDDFTNIYDYFNLTTSFAHDSDPQPYNCNILYGTFLEFGGDYLKEVVNKTNIRNKRKFEVIIIDEVDNLLIDNITTITRLSSSSKGFQFLTPIYLFTYFSNEIYNFIFPLIFKLVNLNKIDSQKRKKYENLIKDPEFTKTTIINITKSLFEKIFYQKEIPQNDEINDILQIFGNIYKDLSKKN